jgi:myo-inositol-1(or 4)-monophosphatase
MDVAGGVVEAKREYPMTNTHEFGLELQVAMEAARAAGLYIRTQWDTGVEMEYKGEVDLVSEVDRHAEKIVVTAIQVAFPGDKIVAEESGSHSGAESRVWYVDPLDGTTNFAHGVPHFCVSVGLVVDHIPTVGVIYEPTRDWLFVAVLGHGATLNERRLRVSETEDLGQALLATGFPYDRRTNPDNNGHRAMHLLRQCQGLRRAGAAALDLAYVAAGWLDGYWEDRLKSWDVAAGLVLVREAGGHITRFDGTEPDIEKGDFVATNGALQPALLDALSSVPIV